MPTYYEDIEVGTTYASEYGKTITEGDIASWPTGRFVPIHGDREFARNETRYDDILPQNSLIMAYMTILHGNSITDDIITHAMYGKDNYRFPAPIYPGDTVYTHSEIINKRDVDEETGIIRFKIELTNQRDDVVAVGENLLLIGRDPDRSA